MSLLTWPWLERITALPQKSMGDIMSETDKANELRAHNELARKMNTDSSWLTARQKSYDRIIAKNIHHDHAGVIGELNLLPMSEGGLAPEPSPKKFNLSKMPPTCHADEDGQCSGPTCCVDFWRMVDGKWVPRIIHAPLEFGQVHVKVPGTTWTDDPEANQDERKVAETIQKVWHDSLTTESKCLAFIQHLNERIIGGKYQICDKDDVCLIELDLPRSEIECQTSTSITFKTQKEKRPRGEGIITKTRILDRDGLVVPLICPLIAGTVGMSVSVIDRMTIGPINFNWAQLLDVARYCDRWTDDQS